MVAVTSRTGVVKAAVFWRLRACREASEDAEEFELWLARFSNVKQAIKQWQELWTLDDTIHEGDW